MVARSLDLVPGCLGSAHAGSRAAEMAGKFELYKNSRGEFWFHLKAANGEIIARSEGYRSKAAAESGIKSVRTAVPGATMIDYSG